MTVPDGSAESFSQIDWIACNLEHDPTKWDTARQRAASQNVKVIPWMRLANEHDTVFQFEQHIRYLINIARIWGCDTIMPNYENEAERYPPILAKETIKDAGWTGNVGWSTQGWLPNDTDFGPINDDPVLLQIFPQDMRFPPDQVDQKIKDCVWHARVDHGFIYVGVTYQTYGNATHDWYPLEGTHSVYPGNEIKAADWVKWFP